MFQLQCPQGSVIGEDGICYSYEKKPIIPVQIKGDLTDLWHTGYFLLDTGADGVLLHIDEAVKLGLDVSKYNLNRIGTLTGIDGAERSVNYKERVLIKIGNFPAIPITIGFSKDVRPGLRLLGRKTILDVFGIVFNEKEVGIFTKQY